MKKICVYTCITGCYDNIIEIKNKDEQYDYICFTNNKNITSKTWNIKYIDEDLDNLTLARKVKILGYRYLKDYDVLVWIDGAINILKPISKFLNDCCDLKKYDMIGFNHKYRDCIYDEINECVRIDKESIENANRLEKFLISEKYPKHNGLIESTVLVRKNNMKTNKLMDLWFDMLINYSRRDQLSFNYCLWKYPININFLDMHVFNNDYFKHRGHNELKKSNKYRLIFDENKVFNYKNVIDSTFEVENNMVKINNKCIKNTKYIVLELYDEVGSSIYNLKINSKSNIKIYNYCDYGDKNYFSGKPIIMFEGDYKKGSVIQISFKLIRNTTKDLVLELNKKTGTIIELNNKVNQYLNENKIIKKDYNTLREEYNNVINSKIWKITKPIRDVRAVKNKIFK